MTSNKRVEILKQAARSINQGDQGVFKRYLLDDFYNYSPAEDEESAPELISRLAGDLQAAIPDLAVSLSDFSEDGESVSFNLTLSGNYTGNLWGADGSGVSATWTSGAAARFSGDKFAFHWPNLAMPELMGVFRQLELVPPPEDMDKPLGQPLSFPEVLTRLMFTGQLADKECSHLDQIKVTDSDAVECPQCIASGDIWPALRMCLICGFVGCCDTSKNKHMKAHYEATGHSLFRSIRLQESWVWCYKDNAMFSGKILEKYRQAG